VQDRNKYAGKSLHSKPLHDPVEDAVLRLVELWRCTDRGGGRDPFGWGSVRCARPPGAPLTAEAVCPASPTAPSAGANDPCAGEARELPFTLAADRRADAAGHPHLRRSISVNALASIAGLLDGHHLREVEPFLHSALPQGTPGHRYDHRARAYDRLIGSRLYNRVVWGTTIDEYHAFARSAVDSAASGWLLDAGCGTLLHTAAAYAATTRPIVVVDQSIGMLRRARQRMIEVAPHRAEEMLFLQADLFDLPFRAGSFTTILSMGMLHLFQDFQPVVEAFRRCLRPEGHLFVSSLVVAGERGDGYLRLLHRAGEVAQPRSAPAVAAPLRAAFRSSVVCRTSGNMAFATAIVATTSAAPLQPREAEATR
jgi:SAM-dependent methyltransferase